MRNPYRWRQLTVAGALLVLAGCGSSKGGGATGPSASDCSVTLSRTTVSADAPGETARVNVDTRSRCSWTASSGVSWIAITLGASGTGSGPVGFTVEANPTIASRTGTLTIANQVVTVTQDAPSLTGRWGVTGPGALRALEFTVGGRTVTRVRFTYFFPISPTRNCDRIFNEDLMVPMVDGGFTVAFLANGLSTTLAVQFQSRSLATGTLGTQTFTNSNCGTGPPFTGAIGGGEATFGRLD